MEKGIERSFHQKILRRVSKLLSESGFQRAKSTFFARRRESVIEFIHVHKFSFTTGYRVHLGIRVLNVDLHFLALNGPDSDSYTYPGSPNGSKYVLRFDVRPESIEKCATEIARWCSEVGLPWFEHFRRPEILLSDPSTPLREIEAARLRLALDGRSELDAIRASEKLFGFETKE